MNASSFPAWRDLDNDKVVVNPQSEAPFSPEVVGANQNTATATSYGQVDDKILAEPIQNGEAANPQRIYELDPNPDQRNMEQAARPRKKTRLGLFLRIGAVSLVVIMLAVGLGVGLARHR
jgi:hypothetical protein